MGQVQPPLVQRLRGRRPPGARGRARASVGAGGAAEGENVAGRPLLALGEVGASLGGASLRRRGRAGSHPQRPAGQAGQGTGPAGR